MFDAYGIRWFGDLGRDNYSVLPRYFAPASRLEYFRLNNLGHSTLQIGTAVMDPSKHSELIDYVRDPFRRRATIDLSGPYSSIVHEAKRSFTWQDAGSGAVSVTTVDSIRLKGRLPDNTIIASQFVHCWIPNRSCPIELAPDGRSVSVTHNPLADKGGRGVRAVFTSSGPDTRFAVVSADPGGGNSAMPCRVRLQRRPASPALTPDASDLSLEDPNKHCALIRAELPVSNFYGSDGAPVLNSLNATITVRPVD
jgi:hypothetical protein